MTRTLLWTACALGCLATAGSLGAADPTFFARRDYAGGADGIAVADQLSILRQVAETVSYAHGNRVVHRGLTPHAVWVRRLADGSLRASVGDWQSSGAATTASGLTGSSEAGVTGLLGAIEPGGQVMSRQTGLSNGFTVNNSLTNSTGVAVTFAAGQSPSSGNSQNALNANFTINGL